MPILCIYIYIYIIYPPGNDHLSHPSRHLWVDDFPKFPWWDMWSFPGGYIIFALEIGQNIQNWWFGKRMFLYFFSNMPILDINVNKKSLYGSMNCLLKQLYSSQVSHKGAPWHTMLHVKDSKGHVSNLDHAGNIAIQHMGQSWEYIPYSAPILTS